MDGCTDVLVSIRLKGCGCGREVQGTQIGPRSALPCASDIFPGGLSQLTNRFVHFGLKGTRTS